MPSYSDEYQNEDPNLILWSQAQTTSAASSSASSLACPAPDNTLASVRGPGGAPAEAAEVMSYYADPPSVPVCRPNVASCPAPPQPEICGASDPAPPPPYRYAGPTIRQYTDEDRQGSERLAEQEKESQWWLKWAAGKDGLPKPSDLDQDRDPKRWMAPGGNSSMDPSWPVRNVRPLVLPVR